MFCQLRNRVFVRSKYYDTHKHRPLILWRRIQSETRIGANCETEFVNKTHHSKQIVLSVFSTAFLLKCTLEAVVLTYTVLYV